MLVYVNWVNGLGLSKSNWGQTIPMRQVPLVSTGISYLVTTGLSGLLVSMVSTGLYGLYWSL